MAAAAKSPLDGAKQGATGARPTIVVIGGGTGIAACLTGLKDFDCDISAIVTVADDGGSSGRLRKDYHMPPPGDIRNCLVALSTGDPLLSELFNYRFPDSILRGHSFGNLLLAVLTSLTGDFRTAVDRAGDLLGVRGKVIPSTNGRVVLVAEHPDGTKSTGEQCISKCRKAITGMELRPTPPRVSEEIEDLLGRADLVVIGPGSLFTSLIPNLLVPGMPEAIARCPGRVVLVANLMTQPGETDHFSLEDHVRVLRSVGRLERLDAVVVSRPVVPTDVVHRYHEAGAEILDVSKARTSVDGVPIETTDLATVISGGLIRHNSAALAAALFRFVTDKNPEEGRRV